MFATARSHRCTVRSLALAAALLLPLGAPLFAEEGPEHEAEIGDLHFEPLGARARHLHLRRSGARPRRLADRRRQGVDPGAPLVVPRRRALRAVRGGAGGGLEAACLPGRPRHLAYEQRRDLRTGERLDGEPDLQLGFHRPQRRLRDRAHERRPRRPRPGARHLAVDPHGRVAGGEQAGDLRRHGRRRALEVGRRRRSLGGALGFHAVARHRRLRRAARRRSRQLLRRHHLPRHRRGELLAARQGRCRRAQVHQRRSQLDDPAAALPGRRGGRSPASTACGG